MARRDDPDSNLFLSVPTAVLYHDKEQLLDGKMVLRERLNWNEPGCT